MNREMSVPWVHRGTPFPIPEGPPFSEYIRGLETQSPALPGRCPKNPPPNPHGHHMWNCIEQHTDVCGFCQAERQCAHKNKRVNTMTRAERLAIQADQQAKQLDETWRTIVADTAWLDVPMRCQMPECSTLLQAADGDYVYTTVDDEPRYVCAGCFENLPTEARYE